MQHKVLSLLQPWADLVVRGHKKVETRSWNTKYRGPLLIHASGTYKKAGKEAHKLWYSQTCKQFFPEFIMDGNNGHQLGMANLYYGAIIGSVELVETFQFGSDRSKEYFSSISREELFQEVAFGDCTEGRWGWLMKNPVMFLPIPAKGSLNVWNWEGEIPQIETRASI